MTTGKTIALTRWTFVGKVMSLLFNMLSRLVFTFLPRSNQVSFDFMAAVTICSDFGAPKNKVCHCFPIYVPWSDGTRCHNLTYKQTEKENTIIIQSLCLILKTLCTESMLVRSSRESTNLILDPSSPQLPHYECLVGHCPQGHLVWLLKHRF